jgi:heat shock protein HtpX
MYICNPLKREGKKVSDLSSTHPPISERIRILRNMSGGANYTDYQRAYSDVRHKSSIIPRSGLTDQAAIPLRQGSVGIVSDAKTTTRATGDIMLTVDNFKFIDCQCGMKLKIPPTYSGEYVKCPKCGTKHTVNN